MTGLQPSLMLFRRYPFVLCLSFLSAPFLFSATSCKKTVTHTIIDTFRHAWQPVTYFNTYAQPALNSAARGDSELVVAGGSMMVRIPVGRIPFVGLEGYYLGGTTLFSPANGAPCINDHLCAYGTRSFVGVTSMPIYSQFSSFTYTPPLSADGSNAITEALYPTVRYPASDYEVIRYRYLLTPAEDYINDRRTVRFDLLRFDSAKLLSPYGFGDTPVAKQVLLHAEPGTLGFLASGYFCAAFYDKFFVYYGGQFFRIDTTGDVKAFGYHPADYNNGTPINNMFTYGDTLFAKSGSVMFFSLDHGENWALFNEYPSSAISYLLFRNMGKDLYGTATTSDMQIWKAVITGRDIVVTEINNDGLQGTLLTSLTRCGKYVFATTPNGIYYRDTALFDQRKTPK